ncbi:hypothetical protein ColTof4_14354 [Colletotrichum tofieldiae]|nr:hypothetical protein ColTof3_14765 [Colletotrichum tofieldiae]GKT81931.1 hypothetical protein ColTof4_14354 [Colletotrichum tofieldiae]
MAPNWVLEAQFRQPQAQLINQKQHLITAQASASRYKQIINNITATLGRLHQTLCSSIELEGNESSESNE